MLSLTAETLTTPFLTDTDELLETEPRSIAQRMDDIQANHPNLHLSTAGHDECYRSGMRKLEVARMYDRPSDSLTLGEVFAIWTRASLLVVEADWSTAIDAVLEDLASKAIDHAEYCRRLTSINVSTGVRRSNITKRAYACTFAHFDKEA